MKDLIKKNKLIKIVFCMMSIFIVIIGLGFSYLIAELQDAPGVVLIGTAITLVGASFVYGVGEIIAKLGENNDLLRELIDKNK